MVLSFDIVKSNKKEVDKLIKLFPQVMEHYNGNLSWDYMVDSGLYLISNANHIFNNHKNKLGLLLGDTSISFNELKEMMIIESKKLYKEGKKSTESDYQTPTEELKQLKDIKKFVKEITESEFKSMFRINNLDLLFPYLNRLELNLGWTLEIEIFNYLASNKVEISDDFLMGSIFDYTNLVESVDVSPNVIRSKMKITKNSEKIIQEMRDLIEKDRNDIDLRYILREVSKFK